MTQNTKISWKTIWPYVVGPVALYLITSIFLFPMYQGKTLYQTDIVQGKGVTQEIKEYKEATGKQVYWTNAMFGGMPIVTNYGRQFNFAGEIYQTIKQLHKGPGRRLFMGGLLTFITLIACGVNPWISLIGGVGFILGTSNLVLMETGHGSKVGALATIPLIIGGFYLVFKEKRLVGGTLFAFGTAIGLYERHPQMLYYLFIALAIWGIVYLIDAIRNKEFKGFAINTGVLIAALALGALSSLTHLTSMKKYGDDTMRGEPILQNTAQSQASNSSSTVKGLDWDYAMQWSHGWNDLWSVFVPGAVGGSNGELLPPNSKSERLFQSRTNARAPLYWGKLPFTSGPPYIGAVVFFFFVMALFVSNWKIRTALISTFVLLMLMSLGRHFAALNRLLFDYLPMYNTFRAPSSVMQLGAVFLLIFSFIGVGDALKDKQQFKASLEGNKLYYVLGLAALPAFFLLLFGGALFDFTGISDANYQEQVADLFRQDRKALLRRDSFRTLLYVLLCGGLLFGYLRKGLSTTYLYAGLGVLLLADFWGIGRRYLDADKFVSESQYEANFAPRPVDQQIFSQEPKGRGYYRVMDYSLRTPFSDASTSYHHNTIGGYSAIKLQRVQDLLDYHVQKGNQKVLNMLNTKYVITQDQQLQVNPGALGNAWFVSNLIPVSTPDEEIDKLNTFNPASDAVVLTSEFDQNIQAGSGEGTIELTEYTPARLTYQTNANSEQLAVFSEVWYGPNKGWEVTIDGQKAEFFRTNYILRAMMVPAGNHTIEFSYDPARLFSTSNTISIIASSLLILLLLWIIFTNAKEVVKDPSILQTSLEEEPEKPKLKKTKRKIKKKEPPTAKKSVVRKKKK